MSEKQNKSSKQGKKISMWEKEKMKIEQAARAVLYSSSIGLVKMNRLMSF